MWGFRVKSRRTLAVAGTGTWLALVLVGFGRLTLYSNTPGQATASPVAWPLQSVIPAPSGKPLMIIALHPQCPCSRATVEELNRILVSCRGKVDVHALLIRPMGSEPGFTFGPLRESLRQLPGVHIHEDPSGQEADRFGAKTSGAVFVYSPSAELLYSGGITASRGHEGDSVGKTAVFNAILEGRKSPATQPVFGCELR